MRRRGPAHRGALRDRGRGARVRGRLRRAHTPGPGSIVARPRHRRARAAPHRARDRRRGRARVSVHRGDRDPVLWDLLRSAAVRRGRVPSSTGTDRCAPFRRGPRGRPARRRRELTPRDDLDARDGRPLPSAVPGAPDRGRCGREGADRPHPPRAGVPEHRAPARPEPPRRGDDEPRLPVLPRRLRRCRGPAPRRAPRTPRLQRGPRGPRVSRRVPRIPPTTRRAPETRLDHGTGRREGGAGPGPLPAEDGRLPGGRRTPPRRREDGGVGPTEDPAHGPPVRRLRPRVLRGESPSRGPPAVRRERNPDIQRALSVAQQWFDGQSGGDTPRPIPNPEVKPAHVPCGTAVREPAGSLPSFEEGLGRRPRYASRPSLWLTTKRAALTAADPWNAVSHSLFLFPARLPPA